MLQLELRSNIKSKACDSQIKPETGISNPCDSDCSSRFSGLFIGDYTMKTKLYNVWRNMRQRCFNVLCPGYRYYGGRGIKVCREWLNFDTFKQWASNNGYEEGLSIERIDNNSGYYPGNCRWATRLEQANNTRQNLNLEYQGRTQTLSQWARELNIKKGTLLYRLKSGWNKKRVFTKKPTYRKIIHFQGRTQTIAQWSKERNIKRSTIIMRITKYGWPIEKALTVQPKGGDI